MKTLPLKTHFEQCHEGDLVILLPKNEGATVWEMVCINNKYYLRRANDPDQLIGGWRTKAGFHEFLRVECTKHEEDYCFLSRVAS